MHNPSQLKVHSGGVLWKKQGGCKAVEVDKSDISALTWIKVPHTNHLFIRTKNGHLTVRNDVYSFGVVLLELLTRRSASGGYTKYQSGRRYVWTGSSVVLPEPVLVRLDSQEGQDYGIHGERVRNACWEYLCQSKAMELKKLIHAVMHLGVLMHWFPAYTTLQPKEKSSVIEVMFNSSSLTNGVKFLRLQWRKIENLSCQVGVEKISSSNCLEMRRLETPFGLIAPLLKSSAIFLAVASLFFSRGNFLHWLWELLLGGELSSLAVGTSSGSGNSITGSGNALCILFPTILP
nr:FACT complex subunit SSRP1 [Tanacetum cinerariifolium]